ncbi:MAG: polyprenyl synthetase family protein [Pseudomonadota bacterium]
MTGTHRVEVTLKAAMRRAAATDAPPRLAAAMRHALFPGGARVRPSLCLAVASACGDDMPELSEAAAAAIELMHCASLVHDDMPCFDNAPVRRGKPAVHVAFDEPLALLAGDAMIVLAFDLLEQAGSGAPSRGLALSGALARATGMPHGICAGQGWESEAEIELSAYHRAKTGALFVAATRMGALAAGADPSAWIALGSHIGEAYQVADDLRDMLLSEEELGKPARQDAVHGRPNAVARLGVAGAAQRLTDILAAAVASIPPCRGEATLRELVRLQAKRLTPAKLVETAA